MTQKLVAPRNLEAEASLLGSALIDEAAIDILTTVPTEAFYSERHRHVRRAIVTLAESGQPADLVLITQHLAATGQLDTVGGPAFLMGLAADTPLSAHARHYANLVTEAFQQREIIRVTRTTMQAAYEGQPSSTILSEHEHALTALTRHEEIERGPAEFTAEALDLITGRGGLTTGFTDLDLATGGLVRGGYNVIAARPSIGKSGTLRAILQHRIKEGDRVALFSIDQSGGEIYALTAAARANVSLTDFRNPRIRPTDRTARLERVRTELNALRTEWENRLVIHDHTSDITRLLQQARTEIRAGATVIAVDHLQTLSLDGRTDETSTVSNISRLFKSLSREYNVTVILLSQLGRDVENAPNKRPTLRHLRQSGAIEEDANQVLMLYRDDWYATVENRMSADPGVLEVATLKNKLGPVPQHTRLAWLGRYAQPANLTTREATP